MRIAQSVWILALTVLIVVPRMAWWGTVPAVAHGDEGGFIAKGIAEYAKPSPPWTPGPNAMPTPHLWLYGAAIKVAGVRDVWPGRAVSSLFGMLQSAAVCMIAWRLTGRWGALIAAVVLALPVQIHFERLALVNVWTTALWAAGLAVLVCRRNLRAAGLFLSGALIGLSAYGYHASRLVPAIVLAGAAPLFWRYPRTTARAALPWLLGCALVAGPYVYGLWLHPEVAAGRAIATSWIASTPPGGRSAVLWEHVVGTAETMAGVRFDDSGAFFPFPLPLFLPVVLITAAGGAIGWARHSPALLCLLLTWLGGVLAGNVLRTPSFAYSCVLICAVPALALLAAGVALPWPWERDTVSTAGPVFTLCVCVGVLPFTLRYLDVARTVPPSQVALMQFYRHWREHPPTQRVTLHKEIVGCDHGFSQLLMPYGCDD